MFIGDPKLYVLAPNFHRFTPEPPRSPMKIGGLKQKFEVSTENLRVSNEIGGSKTKILGSPLKSLGFRRKVWGLQ